MFHSCLLLLKGHFGCPSDHRLISEVQSIPGNPTTLCLDENKNFSCSAISNRAAAICWLKFHGELEEPLNG